MSARIRGIAFDLSKEELLDCLSDWEIDLGIYREKTESYWLLLNILLNRGSGSYQRQWPKQNNNPEDETFRDQKKHR